jgi:hypothetical protein
MNSCRSTKKWLAIKHVSSDVYDYQNRKVVDTMKFKFNVTGDRRRELVMAISEILNTAPKYQGAPTFAYEVGGYSIDRTGTLTGADNWELIADLAGLHSFIPIEGAYDNAMPEDESADENVVIPWEAELGGRVSPYRDYEEPPAYGTPDEEDDTLTIEVPLDGFTEDALLNLEKLVASKAALIKRAMGVDALPIERTQNTLKFPWFSGSLSGEEVNAYARFIGALCAMAKNQQRVTATEKTYDNEKYAFRCFLLRLGFIGPEYKKERRVLLSKLTGSAAFKNGRPQEVTEA